MVVARRIFPRSLIWARYVYPVASTAVTCGVKVEKRNYQRMFLAVMSPAGQTPSVQPDLKGVHDLAGDRGDELAGWVCRGNAKSKV